MAYDIPEQLEADDAPEAPGMDASSEPSDEVAGDRANPAHGGGPNTEVIELEQDGANEDAGEVDDGADGAGDGDAAPHPDLEESDEDDLPPENATEVVEIETGPHDMPPEIEEEPSLEAQLKEMKERWLRAMADMENLRKRSARERDETVRFANERLLTELLPVLDAMEMAVTHLDVPEGASEQFKNLHQGVNLVHKMFLDTLGRVGVSRIPALGESFDPHVHEAMQQVATTDADAGTVVSVMKEGYKIHDRLLRAALVAVARQPTPEEAAAAAAQASEEPAAEEAGGGEEEVELEVEVEAGGAGADAEGDSEAAEQGEPAEGAS